MSLYVHLQTGLVSAETACMGIAFDIKNAAKFAPPSWHNCSMSFLLSEVVGGIGVCEQEVQQGCQEDCQAFVVPAGEMVWIS